MYNTLTLEANTNFLSVFHDFINATSLDSNLLCREIYRDGDNHTPDTRNCKQSEMFPFLFLEIFIASKRARDKSHRALIICISPVRTNVLIAESLRNYLMQFNLTLK